MSIPPQALQKLAEEIGNQAFLSKQQISVVETQIANNQRKIRMLQLTSSEVSILPKETKIYEGVGKMFILSPTADVDNRINAEISYLQSEVVSLGKRLQYLETTHKNSREHIDQIFKSRGGSA